HDDEQCLTADISSLPSNTPGGLDNKKQGGRAYLATRGAEGPYKQPKRGRLWLADGSCIPMTSSTIGPRTQVSDAQPARRVPHECLAIRVARKLKAIDVIDVLSDLFILRRIPAH